ncbi:ribosomal protein S5 domain 2-type protein [Staphylotrichum tortipilum]|uniref:Small ribosomal subunit protein uS9m n=1 Tax=Staphylotrichum tortipilum TaxID=2831512 RepID=A0AAN6MHA2_9PEZI|nr:ribosomal protein S5 domain 2-type protein [Staphylotrichum longicolle]
MMASPTPGLTAALRGVSKTLRRTSGQPLEQHFQTLRLGPAAVVPGRRRCMATETIETTRSDQPGAPANAKSDDRPQRAPSNTDLLQRYNFPKHARPLPVSRSYFCRTPTFTDRYIKIHKLSVAYDHLPRNSLQHAERVSWKSLDDVKQSFAEPVKATDYADCLRLIKVLHRILPSLCPPEVTEALQDFRRDTQDNRNVANPIPVDPHGRALGVGRRKSSTASAFVVEGDGQVLVNGKSLVDYFGRVHDRESAIWALHSTDRISKYNVWARVQGGGTTGQAEALTLAIAKALITHEPALKPALRRAGCITRDPRTVERKKHGHVKARKSPTWVKR